MFKISVARTTRGDIVYVYTLLLLSFCPHLKINIITKSWVNLISKSKILCKKKNDYKYRVIINIGSGNSVLLLLLAPEVLDVHPPFHASHYF